jgi:hypothetical protein
MLCGLEVCVGYTGRVLYVSLPYTTLDCTVANNCTVSEIVLFASLGLIPTYALAQGFDSQTGFYLSAVFNG